MKRKLKEKIQSSGLSEWEEIKGAFYNPLPPPCRVFKVGDRVKYGNWQTCHILEVCDEGRYYKVHQVTPITKFGKTKLNIEVKYHRWIDLLPYRTPEEVTSPVQFYVEDDIHLRFYQSQVSSLLHKVYFSYAGIDLSPDYQRGLVWTHAQKISLIDSIFRNIDIGKFTIIKRPYAPNTPAYEILDGKQRLHTLMEFFESRFTFKGLFFHELHWRDQHHFTDFSISYAETENLTKEQIYRYFLKLNVSGIPISQEHMDKVKELWEKEKKKLDI